MASRDDSLDDLAEAADAARDDSLGSLAQSTRENELKSTRNILWFIGVLTFAFNAFLFGNARNEVAQVGVAGDQVEGVLLIVRGIYGAMMALGIYFILAGVFLKKYPVPLTILSLILYVGANAGLAMLDPSSIASGIIIKIFIVIALAKSVKTALAYQNERTNEG